jgi:IPT/TIG domain
MSVLHQARRPRANIWMVLSGCVAGAGLVACTASGVSPSSGPRITSVQPLAGPVGTRLTIAGSGFDDRANTINFGTSAYANIMSTGGTAIVFVVPAATNPPCLNATPPCAIASGPITPGAYEVSVTNAQGTSNSVAFTVTPGAP